MLIAIFWMQMEPTASLETVTAVSLESTNSAGFRKTRRRFLADHRKANHFPRTPLSAPNLREKIAGSATARFQRFGYVHAGIRRITSSIDIPKSTFYNHFKSKSALASATLSQHFDALMDALGQSGSEAAGARLRRHFESIAPSAQKPGVSPIPAHQHFAGGGCGAPPLS
jgi:AcrR family transcriptional regulator